MFRLPREDAPVVQVVELAAKGDQAADELSSDALLRMLQMVSSSCIERAARLAF
jgi:hypothetical protein